MPYNSAIFSQFSDGSEKEYVWFGPWIVQRRHLDPLGKGIAGSLRHVPGLRKRMIVALWNGAQFYPSLRHKFPFPYDALQISLDGYRARGFSLADGKTTKTVMKDSRYGVNTKNELSVRQGILKGSMLKIPEILDCQENDGYIQFSEKLVPGRIFSHWRDSSKFWDEIGAPLLSVCEKQGIGEKPLAEVVDEALVRVVMESSSKDEKILKAKLLLEKNPIVATAFSHGDTVSSNMIVGRDGVYLVDWDRAGERYAGYDFARLALRYPWNAHYARCAKDVFDRYHKGRFTLDDANAIRLGVAAGRDALK